MSNNIIYVGSILTVQYILFLLCCSITLSESSKVIEFGDKFPDIVKDHPNKSWLIKFYASWCYHCQRLEPTYANVAEKIYHNHDHLIVGRVDCGKYQSTCELYEVGSYPSIIYINKDKQVPYDGDRSLESIVGFAERLNGPDMRELDDCNVTKLTDDHPLVVLTTFRDESDSLYTTISSLAKDQKVNYWFYNLKKYCNNTLEENRLYIVKRYLRRPILYDIEHPSEVTSSKVLEWLEKESFPIYGQIHRYNFDKFLASRKHLVMSVLDRYEPAGRFTKSSAEFHEYFLKLAKEYADRNDSFIYAWTADIELVQSITIGYVPTPNVIVLKPNYRFHLLIETEQEVKNDDFQLPKSLRDERVRSLVDSALDDRLEYHGGSSLSLELFRRLFNYQSMFVRMFKSNPLLTSLVMGLPTLILSFVVYMTCCQDEQVFEEEEDEDDGEEERRGLLNHMKQD